MAPSEGVLSTLQAAVLVDGKRITLHRGDSIPAGIAAVDRERLERRGSIVTPEALREREKEREGFKNAGDPLHAPARDEPADTEVISEDPVVFDPATAEHDDLVDWIRSTGQFDGEKPPNVDDTVKAAGGDPEVAKRILDAEKASGDPRKGVVEELTPLVGD